jgi:hypothetical protein
MIDVSPDDEDPSRKECNEFSQDQVNLPGTWISNCTTPPKRRFIDERISSYKAISPELFFTPATHRNALKRKDRLTLKLTDEWVGVLSMGNRLAY